MLPSWTKLYVCPVSMDQFYAKKFDFWKNVYGFNFSSIIPYVQQSELGLPKVKVIQTSQLLSEPYLTQVLDLKTVQKKDLEKMTTKFICNVNKDGLMHGLCIWFEVGFTPLDQKDNQVILSTSPSSPKTHWKQTTILFPEGYEITAGTPVPGKLFFAKDEENKRRYNLSVTLGYTD